MLVTDRCQSKLPLMETIRLAIAGGADAVQLREHDLEAAELYRLAQELRRITSDAGAALIINHRLDIALAVEADGIQLGWRSLSVNEVRKLAGDRLCVGVSCHTAAQLLAAEVAGADYVLLGPVFPTPSKQGLVQPLGVEELEMLVSGTSIPVIAIGGIATENVQAVRDAGASGVAVISAIIAAADPQAAVKRLLGK